MDKEANVINADLQSAVAYFHKVLADKEANGIEANLHQRLPIFITHPVDKKANVIEADLHQERPILIKVFCGERSELAISRFLFS